MHTALQHTAACLADIRPDSFFTFPPEFKESTCRVYIDVYIEGVLPCGRVVIELNCAVTPKTAYNFKCLCTGEKVSNLIICLTSLMLSLCFFDFTLYTYFVILVKLILFMYVCAVYQYTSCSQLSLFLLVYM